MNAVKVTSRSIAVEHITITSSLTFAEARRKLEDALPKLDPTILEDLASGDERKVESYERAGPRLSIFLDRDHGALLKIVGRPRNAIQYEIGNPATALKMTRHRLAAALYAPLRVVLFENEEGQAVFEYDKPSSLFGQFGDDRVMEVGRYLDAVLEAVLRSAAA
jgi:uncharacterized protein (DUF302 family)